jgi:hypothetical protein
MEKSRDKLVAARCYELRLSGEDTEAAARATRNIEIAVKLSERRTKLLGRRTCHRRQ